MPWLVVSVICAAGLALRGYLARYDGGLPYIDENEIVEQAVAFMSGEWRYYFLKYGPLLMYLLAGVYHVLAFIRGIAPFDYAAQVFLEGDEHYWVARMFCAACLGLTAVAAFAYLRGRYGQSAAFVSCGLLALPGVERLTRCNARTDILLGMLQVLALFALATVATEARPGRRSWLLAGLLSGASLAAKPVPSLLILPCLALASWYSTAHLGLAETSRPRLYARRALRAVFNPGLAWAVPAALAAAALGHPTMVASPDAFFKAQVSAVTLHSSQDVIWNQQGPFESILTLGLPLSVAFALSCAVVVLRRDRAGTLFALFMVTYAAAFYGRASRTYYMVPFAMAGFIVIGMALGTSRPLLQRLERWVKAPGPAVSYTLSGLLVLLLLAKPALDIWEHRQNLSSYAVARQWILDNIPSKSGIRYVGRWLYSLHLVADRRKDEAALGGHFERGRDKYISLKQAFNKGYADYEQSGKPMYRLSVENVAATRKVNRKISRKLARHARKAGQQYVILSGYPGDVMELQYAWFPEATLEAQFKSLAIFKLKPAS